MSWTTEEISKLMMLSRDLLSARDRIEAGRARISVLDNAKEIVILSGNGRELARVKDESTVVTVKNILKVSLQNQLDSDADDLQADLKSQVTRA